VPRTHTASFEDIDRLARCGLAHRVRDVIRRLEAAVQDPPYNYWIHTAPWHGDDHARYHWHLEIVSRLTRMAGFELGRVTL